MHTPFQDGGRLPTSLTFSWFAPSTKPDSISYQEMKYKILVTSGGTIPLFMLFTGITKLNGKKPCMEIFLKPYEGEPFIFYS